MDDDAPVGLRSRVAPTDNLDAGPVMCAVTTEDILDGICRPAESVMVQYVHDHHLPLVNMQDDPRAIVNMQDDPRAIVASLKPTNAAGPAPDTRTDTPDAAYGRSTAEK